MKGRVVPPDDEAPAGQEAALPVEMLAGASLVQQQALESLLIPALLLSLPDVRVIAANSCAAELFGRPVASFRGRRRDEIMQIEDEAAVDRALAALSGGGVDAYRARRCLIMSDGTLSEHLTWVRAVELDGVRSAILLIQPAGSDVRRAEPLVWVEPLVVGTTDEHWRIVSVSTEIADVLGGAQSDYIGRPLIAAAHPDDVGDLLRAAVEVGVGVLVCRNLRLRHRNGSWVHLHVGVIPLTADRPPPLGFVIMPHQPEEPVPADRLSELETRLRHIVAELRGGGFIEGIERLPSAADHPELSRLSSRQWQILIRLLRGDRVPTIAAELFLSQGTVRNHLAAIYSRFDVHSQAELLALLRPR